MILQRVLAPALHPSAGQLVALPRLVLEARGCACIIFPHTLGTE